MRPNLALALALALSFVACAPDSGIEDDENDSFMTDGKADGGIAEGSPEALAILDLVNSASQTTLVGSVGLSQAVATNIVAHRLGDDGAVGTDDDDPFDTLAELDAVPLVGAAVFAALREHAAAGCGGAAPPEKVDLGGVFVTDGFPWGRLEHPVGPRAQSMHFLPGAVPHGTFLVIGMGRGYSDLGTSPSFPTISKAQFEAYWGASVPPGVQYRISTLVGDAFSIVKFDETGVPTKLDTSKGGARECWSFSSPTDPGTRRPAAPGSATPGRETVGAGAMRPFVTEICYLGDPGLNGYGFVEIYVP